MAASEPSNKEAPGDLSEIKRKLAWRMGFAGLMIVALLGGLAAFDHFSAPSEPVVNTPQFTEPVPVPKKTVTQPVTPAEPVSEVAKEETKAPVAEVKAPAVLEPPPRPVVDAQPALARSKPINTRPVTAAAALPPATPAGAQSRSAEPKTSELMASPEHTEAPVELAPTVLAPPRLSSGYALQAGVFSDPRRAEDLHAKLTVAGIPASIESRVQVGPFKNKAEAEAVRAKMSAMGIETVLLPPKGAKK